ncbi:uncharacterized protein [Littorina saxatilis]|uniref:Cyclin-like domain-containing protein n=1 Tax=Littorina saxatilis TaxID=31220 RepID=A0AAN9G715_9CAEN
MAGGGELKKASPSSAYYFPTGFTLDSDINKRLCQELGRQRKQVENVKEHKGKHCPKQMKMKLEQHRECAQHLRAMNSYFSPTTPAVFATAIGIMDSALMKINIPGKYLSCFSAACFLLASKWVLDDYPPTPSSLAQIHHKQWKEADVIRMEVKILGILEWEVPRCTYLSFLPAMMRALFGWDASMSPPFDIVSQAQLVLLQEFSFTFKPATVALGVLNHLVQQSSNMPAATSHTIMALQDAVQVLDSELHEISHLLDTHTENTGQVPFKCKGVGFPKVFKGPYATFLPDYQMHTIPEESRDSVSDLDTEVIVSSPSHADLSVFFSDCDYSYSEDEGEEPISETVDGVTEDVKVTGDDDDSGCDQDSDVQDSSCELNQGSRCEQGSNVKVPVSNAKDIIHDNDSGVCDSSSDESCVYGSL